MRLKHWHAKAVTLPAQELIICGASARRELFGYTLSQLTLHVIVSSVIFWDISSRLTNMSFPITLDNVTRKVGYSFC